MGLISNMINYNKCKYNLSRVAKKKLLTALEKSNEQAADPKREGIRCVHAIF